VDADINVLLVAIKKKEAKKKKPQKHNKTKQK
jgi:hypothetical protein